MWRLRRKTERGWYDGFHIHTGEEAKGLCEILNKLERERDEAREAAEHYRNLYYLPKDGLEAAKNHPLSWENAKAQEELATVTAQRDGMEEKLRIELRGHPNSKLWGDAGLIAATMRCVDALDVVTAQRDMLAEALEMITTFDCSDLQCDNGHGARFVATEALQLLTPKP
jgi:hypothetical protein